MVKEEAIGPAVMRWADGEPSVRALVLIGSRAHSASDVALAADEFSDWDFQVITTRPEMFATRAWMRALGLGEPLAYVARVGRLGTATKVSAVLRDGEFDFVVIPARQLSWARRLLRVGLASRMASMRTALGGLAVVLRHGYRILKGDAEWGPFFARVAAEFPAPRLSDEAVRALAEGFVCDYVSTRNKIERGEFLAAQRWLHHQLAEVNFQLLHELRQRRGEPSQPDGRRIERLAIDSRGIEVSAAPNNEGLRQAADKAAATLRELMVALVPDWRWPLSGLK
jgi:hypothetical protein